MRSIILSALLCLAMAQKAQAAQPPTYSAFSTGPTYSGPLARPILASPEAKTYRTRLTEGARSTPNFGSRYHMVTWGCGTSCETGAAVDAATGKVVFVPFSLCCYAGSTDAPDYDTIQFRPDSNLIVFHGQRNAEGINGDHYYSFDGDTFRFVATKEVRGEQDTSSSPAEPAIAAAQPQEMRTCQKITDGGARLKCYDAVTGYGR